MRPILRLLAVALLSIGAAAAKPSGGAQLVLRADRPGSTIDKNIFGQFSEHLGSGIYGGIWVGPDSDISNTDGYRNDVLAALKALHVPVLRWPGGCFADLYHWRDGIGPQGKRPVRLNPNWGGVEESNQFGLHEFMGFAKAIGADAYVNGNVGTGSPREMADWVEYMTSPSHSALADERRANGRAEPWHVPWLAIGNEAWGCGGNMRPEYYADLLRQYATFIDAPADNKPKLVASGGLPDDFRWTQIVMASAGRLIDAYSLHYYNFPAGGWNDKGPATGFDEALWAKTMAGALRMDTLIRKHAAIMDKYDPKKRIALVVDEWGNWYDPQPGSNPAFLTQQNTLRDALTTAITFNIFVRHADRVRMANIAQMVNVLQAMILTDGPRMVKTPTYYAFQMYVPFQDATALPLTVNAPVYCVGTVCVPCVSAAAARGSDGTVHVALVNLNATRPTRVFVHIDGLSATSVGGEVLTAQTMDAANTFDAPDRVKPVPFAGAALRGGTLFATLPEKSVVMLSLR